MAAKFPQGPDLGPPPDEEREISRTGLAGSERSTLERGALERGKTPFKPGLKVGTLGVAEHYGVYGRGRYAGTTGEGERVGVKGVSLDLDQLNPPMIGDPLTGAPTGNGIGVHGVSGAGTGVRGDSRTGVGVAGKSRSVAGIEGQSEHDVGGVFVSATQAQLRLYPTLRGLPDTARAGDLLALLGSDATLDAPTAELWFCVRASHEHHKAVWKRVSFNATWPEEAGSDPA